MIFENTEIVLLNGVEILKGDVAAGFQATASFVDLSSQTYSLKYS